MQRHAIFLKHCAQGSVRYKKLSSSLLALFSTLNFRLAATLVSSFGETCKHPSSRIWPVSHCVYCLNNTKNNPTRNLNKKIVFMKVQSSHDHNAVFHRITRIL